MRGNVWKWLVSVFFCVIAGFPFSSVSAEVGNIFIDVDRSQCMTIPQGIVRMAIASPDIADVTDLSSTDLLIVAKKTGSTTLIIWDRMGNRYTYNIAVLDEDNASAAAIQHMIGYPNVQVDKAGKTVLLSGHVSNQDEKQRAENIAGLYGEKVVSELTMDHPMQIGIQAQLIEISRNNEKNLGIQWGNSTSSSNSSGSSSSSKDTGELTLDNGIFTLGQSAVNSKVSGNVFGKFGTYADINASLSALITRGDAKVLSEPHMVTMSGSKASILVGGEMPVPTTNSNGSSNVEWKNYGIQMDIQPVADEDGHITCNVKASVSTLSAAAGVTMNGVTIKGLQSREASAVVSLLSGQTMVIGGLLSSTDNKNMSKIPLLGDIPLIGKFFQYADHSHTEQELIIFLTPTLIDSSSEVKTSEGLRNTVRDVRINENGLSGLPVIERSGTVPAEVNAKDKHGKAKESNIVGNA